MSTDDRDGFIPGVHDYCDRWCERCPLSGRCMVYSLTSGRMPYEQLWNEMRSPPGGADADFELEAPQLSGRELDQLIEQGRKRSRDARRDPLCVQAEGYAQLTHEWLRAYAPRDGSPEPEAAEPLQVIGWHHIHIAAKVFRAVSGTLDDDYERRGVQTDENGSAKTALIAIRQSELAWMELRPPDPAAARKAVALLQVLGELREAVEARFPRAYEFVRPGFDDECGTGL